MYIENPFFQRMLVVNHFLVYVCSRSFSTVVYSIYSISVVHPIQDTTILFVSQILNNIWVKWTQKVFNLCVTLYFFFAFCYYLTYILHTHNMTHKMGISSVKLFSKMIGTSVSDFVLVPNHTRWHYQPLLDHFQGSIWEKVIVTTFLVFFSKRRQHN